MKNNLPLKFAAPALLLFYYLLPFCLCIGLAVLVDGWIKWVLMACGFLWPLANVAVGMNRGCD
jgi:hypothetical protein